VSRTFIIFHFLPTFHDTFVLFKNVCVWQHYHHTPPLTVGNIL
jgi:hypothetical protein